MNVWQFIIEFVVCTIMIRIFLYRVQQAHRRKIANRPKPRVLWYHIAEMEIRIYGETLFAIDSPVKAGIKSIGDLYGVDASGHMVDGQCNLNAQLGPPCKYGGQHPKVEYSPLPTYAGDPNWYDEDGRPW